MTERQFSTKFLHWLRTKKFVGAFELKMTKGKSLPFNALKEHQKQALLATKHNFICHKIADDSVGFKPYDVFALGNTFAYVVVQFYTRGCKDFYLIDIDDWCKAEIESERKSLTEEMAQKIGKKESLEMIKTSFIPSLPHYL